MNSESKRKLKRELLFWGTMVIYALITTVINKSMGVQFPDFISQLVCTGLFVGQGVLLYWMLIKK